MIDVFKAAAEIQDVCLKSGWKFCFIGGVALQRWGEPRFTDDVDVTICTGFGKEESFIEAFLQKFEPRLENAADFALKNRVLLLKSSSGVGIDIALGGFRYEEEMADRATYFLYPPDIKLLTCSAEDLIIMKSFADRGQDWVDVERVIVRQGNKLDWNYILPHVKELAAIKESPEIVKRLENLRVERETNP